MNVGVGYLRLMYEYVCWGRERVLAAAERAPEREYLAARGLDHGSIHETLVHVFAAEVLWRRRWMGDTDAKLLTAAEAPSLRQLRDPWALEEAKMRAFLTGVSDAELERQVAYTGTSGAAWAESMWEQMTQMVVHGVEHRSEVALALTQLGHSPGFLDFLAFVRERRSSS